MLRPVVQRECETAALALLDPQEPVREAAALALAQLGLDAQRLGEREQARVVRCAHRRGCEHAQLCALDGAEGALGAAQHRQRAGLEGRHGQRGDLDGSAVGRGERRRQVGGAGRIERGRAPGLAERRARDDGAAVVRALEYETALGRDQLDCLLGDALEQATLVELVCEAGGCGEQAIERVGLGAHLLAQCTLGLDVALGLLARAAGAQGERREHAEGDGKQHVQDDLVDAHVRSIRPCMIVTTR